MTCKRSCTLENITHFFNKGRKDVAGKANVVAKKEIFLLEKYSLLIMPSSRM